MFRGRWKKFERGEAVGGSSWRKGILMVNDQKEFSARPVFSNGSTPALLRGFRLTGFFADQRQRFIHHLTEAWFSGRRNFHPSVLVMWEGGEMWMMRGVIVAED